MWKSADDRVISTSAYHGITQIGGDSEQHTEEGELQAGNSEQEIENEVLVAEKREVIKLSVSTKRGDVKEKEPLDIEQHKEPEKVGLTENTSKKKWAPPGFYGSEKSRDKEVVPLGENAARSVLEAMPPSQDSE